jgi:hypothetical protein
VPRPDDRAAWLYRTDVARRYEAAVAGFLQRTGNGNPLFEATPRVTGGAQGGQLVDDADRRRVVRFRLPPNGEVRISPQPTWHSHLVQLFAYVSVTDGGATAGLELEGGGQRRQVSPVALTPEAQLVTGRYVRFDAVTLPGDEQYAVWLRAGEQGAVVDVADYYPMLYSPQGYYTSPLLSPGAVAVTPATRPRN